MQQIISLKLQGASFDDFLTNCETTAKSVVKNMPLDHKTRLAQSFLQHYFFLVFLRTSVEDATTPQAEHSFEALSNILDDAGISIESLSKKI